jgi:acetyl esterase/lipase
MISLQRIGTAALPLAILLICAPEVLATPISYTNLLARPRPIPTTIIPYGPTLRQRGELFLPQGKAPHPVVVLIHGGCWLADLPGPELTDYAAADLQARGFAVWNIDYRRVGDPGGGYPGIFRDIADGFDLLGTLGPANGLDLTRVVAVGHSAGGHLALWAAARSRLPKNSPLYRANPLRLRGVVSLAGILDLEDYRIHGPSYCGGPSTIDRLLGLATTTHPDVYADTSPARLLPIGIPYLLVSGTLDPIVPPAFADRFSAKARAAGDAPREFTVPHAGHFELIDSRSPAWRLIVAEVERLAR